MFLFHLVLCLRLGKFNPDNQRPRPILIKFNSIRDAHQVTLVKSKLVSSAGSPVYVKRDLSKSERFLESILLKERRRLIDEGVARKHIRIQGVKLYVNSKLIGHAHPSGFCSYPSLGDHAPSLLNISNSTVCPPSPIPERTTDSSVIDVASSSQPQRN